VSVPVWTNVDYHSGTKGITLFLLCRLGIAKVRTHRAFNLAQWNMDIGPLLESEIMALYQNMISWIKRDGKYGGYDAVQHMMGNKTTELLVKSGFINKRPTNETMDETMIGSSNMGGGAMKPAEREWEEDEGYVSTEMAARQEQKRKTTA